MKQHRFRNSTEHIKFRELCFDLQFASEKEKDDIIKEMINMKDKCEDECEVKEMIKTIVANLNAAEAKVN